MSQQETAIRVTACSKPACMLGTAEGHVCSHQQNHDKIYASSMPSTSPVLQQQKYDSYRRIKRTSNLLYATKSSKASPSSNATSGAKAADASSSPLSRAEGVNKAPDASASPSNRRLVSPDERPSSHHALSPHSAHWQPTESASRPPTSESSFSNVAGEEPDRTSITVNMGVRMDVSREPSADMDGQRNGSTAPRAAATASPVEPDRSRYTTPVSPTRHAHTAFRSAGSHPGTTSTFPCTKPDATMAAGSITSRHTNEPLQPASSSVPASPSRLHPQSHTLPTSAWTEPSRRQSPNSTSGSSTSAAAAASPMQSIEVNMESPRQDRGAGLFANTLSPMHHEKPTTTAFQGPTEAQTPPLSASEKDHGDPMQISPPQLSTHQAQDGQANPRTTTMVSEEPVIIGQHTKRKAFDSAAFDSQLYSQEGASAPPPGVEVSPLPAQSMASSRIFSDVDPLVHGMYPRSEQWHRLKTLEIESRPSRKAFFGKVAQRQRWLRAQSATTAERLNEAQSDDDPPIRADPLPKRAGTLLTVDFGDIPEDQLPSDVTDNPAWAKVCARFRADRAALNQNRRQKAIDERRQLAASREEQKRKRPPSTSEEDEVVRKKAKEAARRQAEAETARIYEQMASMMA